MKQLIWIMAAGLLVGGAACKKKGDDKGGGAAAGTACADAAAKAVASLPAGPEGAVVQEKLKGIYLKHCTENKWPAEVQSCYANAKGMADLRGCRSKLPPEQGAKLQAEIMSTMAGAMGGMGGRPPMGHPGGGGDPGAGGAPPGGAPPAGSAAPAPAPEPAPAGSAAPAPSMK